jgi:hypothetical protein
MDNAPWAIFVRAADDHRRRVPHPVAHAAIRVRAKEVSPVPNPLAIGVTLGGLLLDVVAPRPKPRYGVVSEASPLAPLAESRTPRRRVDQHDGPPIAGGVRS